MSITLVWKNGHALGLSCLLIHVAMAIIVFLLFHDIWIDIVNYFEYNCVYALTGVHQLIEYKCDLNEHFWYIQIYTVDKQ